MKRPFERLYDKPQEASDVTLPLDLDGNLGARPRCAADLVCGDARCNRIAGHDGPHMKIRARDFAVEFSEHPCKYSPEVLAVLDRLIARDERVHDPMAGDGRGLGGVCDRNGAVFSGADIEEWKGHDWRVVRADARDPASYPTEPHTIVVSPVYMNKRCADYSDGPTPNTKIEGRRDYALALGRALHPDNLARLTGRLSRAAEYWQRHGDIVDLWGDRVIVNVDGPIADEWQVLLREHGYQIDDVIPVFTRRYGGLANADVRADNEVVIVAQRSRSSCQ